MRWDFLFLYWENFLRAQRKHFFCLEKNNIFLLWFLLIPTFTECAYVYTIICESQHSSLFNSHELAPLIYTLFTFDSFSILRNVLRDLGRIFRHNIGHFSRIRLICIRDYHFCVYELENIYCIYCIELKSLILYFCVRGKVSIKYIHKFNLSTSENIDAIYGAYILLKNDNKYMRRLKIFSNWIDEFYCADADKLRKYRRG